MTEKQLKEANDIKRIEKSIDTYINYIKDMGDYELQLVHKRDTTRTIHFSVIDLKKGDMAYITSVLTEARKTIADHLENTRDILQEEFKNL